MLYICKKREQSFGVQFGVMDTDDGVVEYYSPHDLMRIVKECKISIEGMSFKNGKCTFKVLKPTSFAEVSSVTQPSPVDTNITPKAPEVSHKVQGGSLIISYPINYGLLDDMTDKQSDDVLKPFKSHLDKIVAKLFNIDTSERLLDYLDGSACVGYGGIKLPNTNYTLSIYSNPDQFSNNTVKINGFGVDIDGIEGKGMPDCHFDSQFCDAYVSKFKAWLTNLLGSDKEVLTQDSECVKHFIKLSKTVCDKFNSLFKGNTLGIKMNKLLNISVTVIGSDTFNLLERPTFSVPYSKGCLFTKYIASLENNGKLQLVYDGYDYSIYTDNCKLQDFGFAAFDSETMLFTGTEDKLLDFVNHLKVLDDTSYQMVKARELISLYHRNCVQDTKFTAELMEFLYGLDDDPNNEQYIGYRIRDSHLTASIYYLAHKKTHLLWSAYNVKNNDAVVADVWLYCYTDNTFEFNFSNYDLNDSKSYIIDSIDNKRLSFEELERILNAL